MKITLYQLQRAAAIWIFPGLVAAMVAGNEGWRLGPLPLGQVLSWVNDAAAAILVFGRFADRSWAYALVTLTVAFKVLTIAGVAPAYSDLAFDVGLGALFCVAGAIIVSERPGLVYRQLLWISVLSIPLMLVQMSGVSVRSEALNTEHTEDVPDPAPTVFVSIDDLQYRTAQARPSAFTHSNNFLSLLAAFMVALHFSRLRTPFLTWRDMVVSSFAILTMAKISLLVLAVVLGWKFLTGRRMQRARIMRVAGFAVALLVAYVVIFPGLFVSNVGVYKVTYSFFIRANDFAAQLPEGALRRSLETLLLGTPRAAPGQGGGLSGYAQIVTLLPVVAFAGLLLLPLLAAGTRAFLRRYAESLDTTVLVLFVVVLYPAAVPMFRAQIFWFIAGFALLPFLILLEPRRFRGRLGYFSTRDSVPAR